MREPCWKEGIAELIGSHIGVVMAACLWIGILFVAGCGEENITEVIVSAPGDTLFVEVPVPGDTLFLPCPPGQFDFETGECLHEGEREEDEQDGE